VSKPGQSRNQDLPMRAVVALTLFITGFAGLVALWMYWLAGMVVG